VITGGPFEEIRRVFGQYGQLCDEGRFDEWIQLFEPDARFHVMGRTTTGHDDIVAFMRVGQREELRGRHAMFQPVIDVADDERTAKVWLDFAFIDKANAITQVGRYHDELVRGDDGRWRIALHEIVFLGKQPDLAAPPPGV
jgi:3-phenylpropionate/cinnamic acid dioxygenase small subunit